MTIYSDLLFLWLADITTKKRILKFSNRDFEWILSFNNYDNVTLIIETFSFVPKLRRYISSGRINYAVKTSDEFVFALAETRCQHCRLISDKTTWLMVRVRLQVMGVLFSSVRIFQTIESKDEITYKHKFIFFQEKLYRQDCIT